MQFNPKALLVLVAFLVLVSLAVSSSRGPWFYAAEAVTTLLILGGVAGLWRSRRAG